MSKGFLQNPSVDLQAERSSVDFDNVEEQEEQHPQMPNTLKPTDANFKYGQHIRRPSTFVPRPCRPPNIPFDTEKFTEIFIKLENLKNLVSFTRIHSFVVRR